MNQRKVYRDESTPDRREIWCFVERAAARATAEPNRAGEHTFAQRGGQDGHKTRPPADSKPENR